MAFKSLSLYSVLVLILGGTWFAVKLQLGVVDPVLSVTLRVGLAAFLVLAWCVVRKRDMRFNARDHAWIALQGALWFCAAYIFLYRAVDVVPSGLVALAFSTVLAMNVVLGRVLFAAPLSVLQVLGVMLCGGGVALAFAPEIHFFMMTDRGYAGAVYALSGTGLTALGNMVSARNQRRGLPALPVNAYALLYGALAAGLYGFWTQVPLMPDTSMAYISSLLYLAVAATALAIGLHLMLLKHIGPSREGYVWVLVPVVALWISVVVEDFAFTPWGLVGTGLVLVGNVLVLAKAKHFSWLRSDP